MKKDQLLDTESSDARQDEPALGPGLSRNDGDSHNYAIKANENETETDRKIIAERVACGGGRTFEEEMASPGLSDVTYFKAQDPKFTPKLNTLPFPSPEKSCGLKGRAQQIGTRVL